MPEHDRSDVLQALANIFKSHSRKMEALLQGKEVPLKKEYDKIQAKNICKKIREAGAQCKVEEIPEQELALLDDHLTELLVPAICPSCQNHMDKAWLKCPVCGYALQPTEIMGSSDNGEFEVSDIADDPGIQHKDKSDDDQHGIRSSREKLLGALFRFVHSNTEYYRRSFTKFGNPRKPTFALTWHWPAFFAFFFWALYRKMWVWAAVYVLGGSILTIAIQPGLVSLVWLLAWPLAANYIYFRHATAQVVLARDNPDEESLYLGRGGVSRKAVMVGILVLLLLSSLVSNYFTSQFMEKYGEQMREVLPGSGSQYRGDGTALGNIDQNSNLDKTSLKLSGLATSLKILLVTDEEDQNKAIIKKYFERLDKGDVVDAWNQTIRASQQTSQYLLISAGPDQKFETDDDLIQPINLR